MNQKINMDLDENHGIYSKEHPVYPNIYIIACTVIHQKQK